MRLLIYTQAVDQNDPVLGFFHRWVEEFAKHFGHIHVVCLREGDYTFPKNVSVYSLGKEGGESRVKYVLRFYRHLFALRGQYDAVFAHMNPHYILLGGLYWKILGIPIFFWRNHAKMNWMTRIAAPLSKRVFHTSPFACTARYAHATRMPVGIDTERFVSGLGKAPQSEKKKILFLGRISPVKHVELFLEAGKILGDGYELHVYGDAPKQDAEYAERVRTGAPENVHFHSGVRNDETPEVYRSHDVYVNLTPKGSMDKTVLEAVACGIPVVVTNESFLDTVTEFSMVENPTPESLAEKIVAVAGLGEAERERITSEARRKVVEKHSLKQLGIMFVRHVT